MRRGHLRRCAHWRMPLRRERRSADWLAELDEATLAVEALPFVPAVGFVDVAGKASSSKAYATVTCCWSSSHGTFKRVKVGLSRKHPTHLEALCALHDKLITEHGGDHRHDYRALEKRAREDDELTFEQVIMAVNALGERCQSVLKAAHLTPPREAAVAALSAAKSIAEQEAMTPHVRVWCST